MRLNIKVGSEAGLCGSCRHSHIVRTVKGLTIDCDAGQPRRIPAPVLECNLHSAEGHSRHEMERLGWVLEVKKGEIIGFKPPKRMTYYGEPG